MAVSSFLALLDDIAATLDDVAVMTKVATKKTAGILGDDLAVNAEQVTGVAADRELPVVWAVAKGSTLNKVILVPAALAISAFVPWLITPLLMAGGTFLCYEGAHKVIHKFFHREEEKAEHKAHVEAVADESVDMVAFEEAKVKGAIRTDFILSAEIIVIALGTVVEADFTTRVLTLIAIAAIMTVGVYGLVAGIVKLDDAGVSLSKSDNGLFAGFGRFLVSASPFLMRFLGIAGTIAMFLVGGDILLHGIPGAEDWLKNTLPQEGIAGTFSGLGASATTGIAAGLIAMAVVAPIQKMRGASDEAAAN
jgi:predicted DNA repair protein MutK